MPSLRSVLLVLGSPRWQVSAFMLSWFPRNLGVGEVRTTPSSQDQAASGTYHLEAQGSLLVSWNL